MKELSQLVLGILVAGLGLATFFAPSTDDIPDQWFLVPIVGSIWFIGGLIIIFL